MPFALTFKLQKSHLDALWAVFVGRGWDKRIIFLDPKSPLLQLPKSFLRRLHFYLSKLDAISINSFEEETVIIKSKLWVLPPPHEGIEPVTLRLWGGSNSDELPERQTPAVAIVNIFIPKLQFSLKNNKIPSNHNLAF